jgi:hypothetical protein
MPDHLIVQNQAFPVKLCIPAVEFLMRIGYLCDDDQSWACINDCHQLKLLAKVQF